jgi:hypothetical protein
LQELATKLDESPRPEFVNAYGDYPADAYLEEFGSWPEALVAANLSPVDDERRERRKYSRVEVLDAVAELAEELGHPPTKGDMNEHGRTSASPVASRFKDWDTALELAGVVDIADPPESETDSSTNSESSVTTEELIGELQELDKKWSKIDRKLLHSVGKYHPDEYVEAFGSLETALAKAGINEKEVTEESTTEDGRSQTAVVDT